MKIKASIIAILFSLSLVGCSNNIDDKSNTQEPTQNQEQTNNSNKVDESNKYEENNEANENKNKEAEFKIYSIDSDDTNKKIEFLSFKKGMKVNL